MPINIYIDFKLTKEINLIINEYIKRLKPLHRGIGVNLNVYYYKDIRKINETNIQLIKISSGKKTMDSEAFANFLINNNQNKLNFIIADGIETTNTLELTTITLTKPNQLLLLVEQIYRSTTIWNNSNYHK